MAVNKTINKRTNTHGAMRNCIEYVLRQDKTGELLTYVTGPYCHDEINHCAIAKHIEHHKTGNAIAMAIEKPNWLSVKL